MSSVPAGTMCPVLVAADGVVNDECDDEALGPVGVPRAEEEEGWTKATDGEVGLGCWEESGTEVSLKTCLRFV